MEVNKIQEGKHTIFIFSRNPDSIAPEIVNPTFNIELEEYPAEDLLRYCTKLFYDKDIPVDYNKVLKIALEKYLNDVIGGKELKEIEEMKAKELKEIEARKKVEKPKFDWDSSNRKENK